MNKPMYMIADLAVGGYWPGDPDASTPFPAQMKIDYLRAYQSAPARQRGTFADPPPSGNNRSPTTTPTSNVVPADILWRNSADGTLATWAMSNSQVTSGEEDRFQGNIAAPDASWSVAGIGDFSGNGATDILWRNQNGSLVDWGMNGSQIASVDEITLQGSSARPDANWSVAESAISTETDSPTSCGATRTARSWTGA